MSSPIARRANSWRPAGGRLAETLDSVLEIARPAFGERKRSVGHAAQLHTLLGTSCRNGPLEVATRGLRVESLRGTRS